MIDDKYDKDKKEYGLLPPINKLSPLWTVVKPKLLKKREAEWNQAIELDDSISFNEEDLIDLIESLLSPKRQKADGDGKKNFNWQTNISKAIRRSL